MSSNDFNSLLSNFAAATGTKTREGKRYTKLPLREATERLWNISQIRRTTQKRAEGTSTVHDVTRKSIHIALCACIVNDLPHEKVWQKWIKSFSTKSINASMYVHAKTPSEVKSPWTKSHMIPKSFRPNWNDIRIVQAMLELSRHALNNNKVTHVMFITESCIPICTLDEIYDDLQNAGDGKSFVRAYNRESANCTRFDELQCFGAVKSVPQMAVHKVLPGWSLLCRDHIQKILNLNKDNEEYSLGQDLFPAFANVWAPEEVFFPTCLALLGVLPGEDVVHKSAMWARWDENARGKDKAHPLVYDNRFGSDLLREARSEGCWFMRKFKRPLDPQLWESIIFESAQIRAPSSSATNDAYSSIDEKERKIDRRKRYREHDSTCDGIVAERRKRM